MSEHDSTNRDLSFATVPELADAISQCAGHYSFLIGAGTSSHDIPTSRELIEDWRSEKFDSYDGELDREEWIQMKEEEMAGNEDDYGFWFEECHRTVGERRHFIENLVKDAEPNFGHIVLASMMNHVGSENSKEDYGYIPVTLTPNFDDLVYDAFYLFLEDKPLLVDHNAIASQFQLTRERPTIIKLHGDYLYNNIQNTAEETANLRENIERALSLVAQEYGLVVLGYSGMDDSIMSVFEQESFEIPDYGLFWCTLDADGMSDRVKNLLGEKNAFVVEIEGSVPFFNKMYEELSEKDGFSVPNPDQIEDRASDRADQLREVVESEGPDALELQYMANRALSNGENQRAYDLFTDALEKTPESVEAKYGLGKTLIEMKRYKDALDEFNDIIDNSEEDLPGVHNHRGILKVHMGEPKQSLSDFEQAISSSTENSTALANKGTALSFLGRFEEAMDFAEKAMEQEGTQASGHILKAKLLLAAGKYQEAIKLLNTAVQNYDHPEEVYSLRSLAYSYVGDHRRAIEDRRRHIEIGEGSIFDHVHLAIRYLVAGDYETAAHHLQTSSASPETAPENAAKLLTLSLSMNGLGEDWDHLATELKELLGEGFETALNLPYLEHWLESEPEEINEMDRVHSLIERFWENKVDYTWWELDPPEEIFEE